MADGAESYMICQRRRTKERTCKLDHYCWWQQVASCWPWHFFTAARRLRRGDGSAAIPFRQLLSTLGPTTLHAMAGASGKLVRERERTAADFIRARPAHVSHLTSLRAGIVSAPPKISKRLPVTYWGPAIARLASVWHPRLMRPWHPI